MAINEPWCSGNIVLQLLPTTYGSTRGGNVFTGVCDSVKRTEWGGGYVLSMSCLDRSCPVGGVHPVQRGGGASVP